MTAPVWTSIPAVGERHFDELAFLWEQRNTALRAPEYTYPRFVELEGRICTHMSGLRIAGTDLVPLAEERLASDDPFEVFASAWALANPAIGNDLDGLVDRFATAEGALAEGLKGLLSLWPQTSGRVDSIMRDEATAPLLTAACAEVLAFHRALPRSPGDLEPFVLSADPELQKAGWRISSLAIVPLPQERYSAALREDDAGVQLATLTAGAWCGIPGVYGLLRWAAQTAPGDFIHLLPLFGVLVGEEDLALLADLGSAVELGPLRFDVLASSGRVRFLEQILEGMENADPLTAFAAGRAFSRLTGLNIDSTRLHRIPLPGEADEDGSDHQTDQAADPDGARVSTAPSSAPSAPSEADSGDEDSEFESEFYEELTLPDPEAARKEWAALEPTLGDAQRIGHGVGMDVIGPSALQHVDMLTRYQTAIQLRFHGRWDGSLVDLEAFGG